MSDRLVYILYLRVTSGAARYGFYVGTMRIATQESDTVGLRDFHSSAQRIVFCHKTDVFILETRNTEARHVALSSFPFLHLSSALRKCVSSPSQIPTNQGGSTRELNIAKTKTAAVITGFRADFDSKLLCAHCCYFIT